MHFKKESAVTRGWFLVSLLAVLGSLFQPAFALTREEIGQEIQRGQAVESLEDVPNALFVGSKYAKGSFGGRWFGGTSGPPYIFLVQTCHQWIANMTFLAKLNGGDPDIMLIERQCLGQDTFRAGAEPMSAEVHLVYAEMLEYLPSAALPITDVFLELDGKITKPLGGRSATDEGGYSAVFDAAISRASKSAIIIVTVDSSYQLKVKIPKKVRRQLFSAHKKSDKRNILIPTSAFGEQLNASRAVDPGGIDQGEALMPDAPRPTVPRVLPLSSPPEKLDSELNTSGVTFELEEIERHREGGITFVSYSFKASGFPTGKKYVLWQILSGTNKAERLCPVEVNDAGELDCRIGDAAMPLRDIFTAISRYVRGEPHRYVMVSTDQTVYAFAKTIPFPIEDQVGSCRVSVEMRSRKEMRALLSGFPAGESVEIMARLGKQIIKETFIAEESTRRDGLQKAIDLRPSPGTSGKATVDVKAPSCSLSVTYKWGSKAKSQ